MVLVARFSARRCRRKERASGLRVLSSMSRMGNPRMAAGVDARADLWVHHNSSGRVPVPPRAGCCRSAASAAGPHRRPRRMGPSRSRRCRRVALGTGGAGAGGTGAGAGRRAGGPWHAGRRAGTGRLRRAGRARCRGGWPRAGWSPGHARMRPAIGLPPWSRCGSASGLGRCGAGCDPPSMTSAARTPSRRQAHGHASVGAELGTDLRPRAGPISRRPEPPIGCVAARNLGSPAG
jgi:hypothetical protein